MSARSSAASTAAGWSGARHQRPSRPCAAGAPPLASLLLPQGCCWNAPARVRGGRDDDERTAPAAVRYSATGPPPVAGEVVRPSHASAAWRSGAPALAALVMVDGAPFVRRRADQLAHRPAVRRQRWVSSGRPGCRRNPSRTHRPALAAQLGGGGIDPVGDAVGQARTRCPVVAGRASRAVACACPGRRARRSFATISSSRGSR